jgi:hypothetical protein
MTKKAKKAHKEEESVTQPVQPETGHEYEDSPDAPYNRQPIRPLGPSVDQQPKTEAERIEKEKEYFHGGTKP